MRLGAVLGVLAVAGCGCNSPLLEEQAADGDADTDVDVDADVDTDSDSDSGGPCEVDEDCSSGACDDSECVDCRDDGGGVDPGCEKDAPHCDEASRVCGECETTDDCENPAASVCDEAARTCGPCEENVDCAHLDDTVLCLDGTCIECTVEDETPCGANSCNPATNRCTDTPRGSVDVCEACVADSECMTDHRCVPMEFDGVEREGGYCLKQQTAGCARPYTTPIDRVSLSGAPSESYCGVAEELTTCEAVLDLIADAGCGEAGDCGATKLDDGRCETVLAVTDRCTYSCGGSLQCPSGYNCSSGYCGGS